MSGFANSLDCNFLKYLMIYTQKSRSKAAFK